MISTELDVPGALTAAAAVTAVLAVLHLLAPRVHTLPGVPRRAIGSFGGGLAVAFVFLHLLPDLAQGSQEVGEALADELPDSPLHELAGFVLALAGFALLYGLERLAVHRGSARGGGPAGSEPDAWLYRLHLGSYAVYNGLITYTLPVRFRTGLAFALLFAVAMGLHFVLTDRGLSEHYPRRFRRSGRWVLSAALVAGWVLALVSAPGSTLVVALATGLLSGAVLLNVFKEELPSVSGRSSYPWFLAGLVVYAVLLTTVTAFAG